MPCYNSSEFIDDVVINVRRQIENRNIEFIIIDDCSTDNTLLKIQEYESSQIKVIKNDVNSGPNFSRNIGLKSASGKYVIFLDSDDFFLDSIFDCIETILKDDYFDILSFGFNFISEDKKLLIRHTFRNEVFYNQSIINSFLSGKIYAVCWNKIYNRLFLVNNNIFFTEDKIHGRDSIFALDCCFYAKKFVSIDQKLYYSKVRNGSFSRNFSLKNVTSLINNLDLIKQKTAKYSLDRNYVNIIDYLKALFWLLNNQFLLTLFNIGVLKKSKFSEILLSISVVFPFIIFPVSTVLKLFKYKPY
jgi:glycosyltransferase involved in cell wall biosynthesis